MFKEKLMTELNLCSKKPNTKLSNFRNKWINLEVNLNKIIKNRQEK